MNWLKRTLRRWLGIERLLARQAEFEREMYQTLRVQVDLSEKHDGQLAILEQQVAALYVAQDQERRALREMLATYSLN